MNNNKFIIATGIGILTFSSFGVIGLVSAANIDTTTATTAQSSSFMAKGGKRGGDWLGFGGDFGKWREDHGWMFGKQDSAIQAAIEANDYNAYLAARNANTNRPANAIAPTQEQFNQMVTRTTQQKAADSALQANDYNAYVTATTITREEFSQKVNDYTYRQAVQVAIKNNDYNAFVSAWNANASTIKQSTVPTQEQFNQMVTRSQKKENTTTQ